MPTYVCFSDLFSVPCSKPPSKYFSEEQKKWWACSSRYNEGILKVLYISPKFGSAQALIKDVLWGSILDKDCMFAWGKARTGKKNYIFVYNKYKLVDYLQSFGRG